MTTKRDAAYYRNLSEDNDNDFHYQQARLNEILHEIERASLNGKYKVKIYKNIYYYGGNEPANAMDEGICGTNSIYKKILNNENNIAHHLRGLGFRIKTTDTHCTIYW